MNPTIEQKWRQILYGPVKGLRKAFNSGVSFFSRGGLKEGSLVFHALPGVWHRKGSYRN